MSEQDMEDFSVESAMSDLGDKNAASTPTLLRLPLEIRNQTYSPSKDSNLVAKNG
jgi:hypothetical protein